MKQSSDRTLTPSIRFEEGFDPSWIDQILELHNKTELKRSLDKRQVVSNAFVGSFAVITAWSNDRLVGCGRLVSDGSMYSGIFDVVIDPEFQKMGIGQKVVERLIAKAPPTFIVLTSTFGNEPFYAKLGFRKHKTAMALYPSRKDHEVPYLEPWFAPKDKKQTTKRLPLQVLVIPYLRTEEGFRFALFKRRDGDYWQFVAGGVEVGESVMNAAKREAQEEAGISPSNQFTQLKTICSVPANIFKEWNSWPADTFVVTEYSFGVEVNSKDLVLTEEHTESRWCSFDESIELLKWDSNRTALWELQQRLLRDENSSDEHWSNK